MKGSDSFKEKAPRDDVGRSRGISRLDRSELDLSRKLYALIISKVILITQQ